MGSEKYVGLDVHKKTISIAVMNSAGKLIMESIIETKAITILQFITADLGWRLTTARNTGMSKDSYNDPRNHSNFVG